jgi:catechol 2,3-dioxygenase-like lactoylglutathione lyase family enzyme
LGGEAVATTPTIVTLGVQDLKRSIRFYEAGLAFPRVPYEPETIAFFDLGGAQLGLFPRDALAEDAGVSPAGEGFSGVTLSRFVASSEEVRAFLDRAVRAGGTSIRAARATTWGGFAGYFADPDGHLWEVACDSKTYAKEIGAA